MNIGSSSITFTDLTSKVGTVSIDCHLDSETQLVSGVVIFGNFVTDANTLGTLTDVIGNFVELFDTNELAEVKVQWRNSVTIRHPAEGSNDFRIEIGGFIISYRQLLELIVGLDTAANDILNDHNEKCDS